jgi:enoyl-CoA hydratase/carnithine racemase
MRLLGTPWREMHGYARKGVTREQRGDVLLTGLTRVAKRNAFDLAMLDEVALAYGEPEHDDALRCGVLFAHGDHLTAGLDLAQVAPALLQHGQRATLAGVVSIRGECKERREPNRSSAPFVASA